jgi:hypothetical protein
MARRSKTIALLEFPSAPLSVQRNKVASFASLI